MGRQPLLGAGGGASWRGSGIVPMKTSANAGVAFIEWLGGHCAKGDQVGVDGRVLALARRAACGTRWPQRGATLRMDLDLLEEIWAQRPGLPHEAVFERAAAIRPGGAGRQAGALRDAMKRAGAAWHLISSLDDIAWVLNLRGSDVSYNPVFLAHLLIGAEDATLFVLGRQGSAASAGRAWPPTACAWRAMERRHAPGAVAGRRLDPGRSAPGHRRRAAVGAARRATRRADQPDHAGSSRARPTPRSRMMRAGDGAGRRRAVRILRVARAGSGPSRKAYRADHRRADHRGPRQAPRATSSAQFRARSRASTPTARCRTTAPPTESHAVICDASRSATACC